MSRAEQERELKRNMSPVAARALIALTDRPEFGDVLLLAAKEVIDIYDEAIALEKGWRELIPKKFRIEPTWTREALEWRIAELRLGVGGPDE